MVGAGAAGLGIVSVGLIQAGSLQRGLHTAVGGEEGNLLALVLGQLLGDILQNELLGSGQASLSGGVGSGDINQLDAQSVSVLLQQVVTANDQLHSHVTGEGVVDEHINAPLCAGLHDGVALSDFVSVHDNVSSSGDNGGIFLRSAGDQQDVVAAHLTNLVEASLCAGNSLAHDNGLDIGVGSEGDDLGNGGLHLGHEVVGVGSSDNVLRAVGGQSLLSSAELLLALRDGAGQNGDLPVVGAGGLSNSGSGALNGGSSGSLGGGGCSGSLSLGAAAEQAQSQSEDQQQANHLFHNSNLLDCLHDKNRYPYRKNLVVL